MLTITMSRRDFLKYVGLASGWTMTPAATAWNCWGSDLPCQVMRNQKLRWIVPYSPGGGFDVYSRLIAPQLATKIGAAISVENFPGAGGSLGSRRIQRAQPDGRTLGLINAPGLLTAALTGATQAPNPVSYTHLTLPTMRLRCRSRWGPEH